MEKRSLKKQYKNSEIPMGVYKITNQTNGKIFIGGSKNLVARISRHKFELKFGSEGNKELLNDYQNLGEDKFSFEILDRLKYKDDPDYDYSEDLETLTELWKEKLLSTGLKLYN
jgi:hypothetical protein